jgi:predicted lipoprotein with Yx(FWY)xxD motif
VSPLRVLVALTLTLAVAAGCGGSASQASGPASIVVRDSQFGKMLFNSKKQAIYIFQIDTRNHSNCYGDCAAAWPPVYTTGKPRALKGVKKSLLGSFKRSDGRRQVTYAGQPLYYYAHEGPGQVFCHNVFSYGGWWWVMGPNGKHRPA